jgi:hypothetical protein
VRPIRVWRKRKGVKMRWYVARAAWINIIPPNAAHIAGALEHKEVALAGGKQPCRHAESAEARTHDDDLDLARRQRCYPGLGLRCPSHGRSRRMALEKADYGEGRQTCPGGASEGRRMAANQAGGAWVPPNRGAWPSSRCSAGVTQKTLPIKIWFLQWCKSRRGS